MCCQDHDGRGRRHEGRGDRDDGCRERDREPRRERDDRDERDGCDCGCEDEAPYALERRFISKAERLEQLEDYLDQLEKEAQGVREAIAEMKAGMKGQENKGSEV